MGRIEVNYQIQQTFNIQQTFTFCQVNIPRKQNFS